MVSCGAFRLHTCRPLTCIDRHAIANTLIGVGFFYVFMAAVLHYTGTWYGAFLPMSDSSTYDNTGAAYNVSRILTADFTLNEEAYKSYSPLFLRYILSWRLVVGLGSHV
jgi:hypothetical protein